MTKRTIVDSKGKSPWVASVEAAAKKATEKAAAAKAAMLEKAAGEVEYARRLNALQWQLGNVLLLAEAGSLSAKDQAIAQVAGAAVPGDATGPLLMLENGPPD